MTERKIKTLDELIAQPVSIEGGWRVGETENYYVDVMRMMFGNLRIVTTLKVTPWQYERGWCYHEPPFAVALRARTFDPELGEEPEGWVREVGTGRRACRAYYPPSDERPHDGFVSSCPHCGDERLER